MTKLETISNLKAYLDGDTAIGNIIPLRSVLESAIKYLEPSLPSNLDEAARFGAEMDILFDEIELSEHEMIFEDTFHKICKHFYIFGKQAGAEWMAGQGVCADAEVCKLADRAWVTPLDEKLFQNEVYDKFKAGDKVVVQIRKK